jgi:hypothetical protein
MPETYAEPERHLLLALLEAGSMSHDALEETVPVGTMSSLDGLIARGSVRRSIGGNFTIERLARDGVIAVLGDDYHAPIPEIDVLPITHVRKEIAFYNGVMEESTYRLLRQDGICGCREEYGGVVRGMQENDLILHYVMEPYSEWLCIQRLRGRPYHSSGRLHDFTDLPWRLPCEFVVALPPGQGLGRVEAADAARLLGGKAATYRDSPKRVNPIAARVIITRLWETQKRIGSVIPTIVPGPEYGDLFR